MKQNIRISEEGKKQVDKALSLFERLVVLLEGLARLFKWRKK